MGITPGRYKPYDDHTVECADCTRDGGALSLIPERAIQAHELWHEKPEAKLYLTPLTGGWPSLGAQQPAKTGSGEEEPETRIPELTDVQLIALAEEAYAERPADWPPVDHDAWLERFVNVGRLLSGKVIRG